MNSGSTSSSIDNDIIGEAGLDKSLIFVLVDGMGICYLKRLSSSSFLNSSPQKELLSVFPSTTASAMISLATGMPPAEHGISGRYSYNKARKIQINTLAYRDRFNGELLTQKIPAAELWPYRSFITNAEIPAYSVIPRVLRKTSFENYLCGNSITGGYDSIAGAVDLIIENLYNERTRGFYFLYLWELDSLGHKEGTKTKKIDDLLLLLDSELTRLREKTKSLADMIVSADHGQIDSGDAVVVTPEHDLMKYLETPPFGEPRAAQLQVLRDRTSEFKSYFNETFGNRFSLYPIRQSSGPDNNSKFESDEAAVLFGADKFSARAIDNFGNFLAVARADNLLVFTKGAPESAKINKGEHGGILPDERLIPLIIPD